MRGAAKRVRDELIRLGLKTEGLDPAELERSCEELVDLARKHRISPIAAARDFAYRRATIAVQRGEAEDTVGLADEASATVERGDRP
jgi:hypothetical protein